MSNQNKAPDYLALMKQITVQHAQSQGLVGCDNSHSGSLSGDQADIDKLALVAEYHSLDKGIKQAEKRRELLKSQLKALIQEAGVNTMQIANYGIELTTQEVAAYEVAAHKRTKLTVTKY